jgi:hypothetical protein
MWLGSMPQRRVSAVVRRGQPSRLKLWDSSIKGPILSDVALSLGTQGVGT